MHEEHDGGPAFPVTFEHREATSEHQGMSLRDYFAGKAMARMLPMDTDNGRYRNAEVLERTASLAYAAADAMLEARAEPKEPEPLPPHLTYDAWTTPREQHEAIKRLAERPDFAHLPDFLRHFVNVAAAAIDDSEDGIPF